MSNPASTAPPARPLGPFPQLPGGGLHFLSGASGVGKTAFIASMSAAIHQQREWCGQQPAPLPQAVVTLDRAWGENGQWFARAGYPDIPHYSLIDDKGYAKKNLAPKGHAHRMTVLNHCLESLYERYPSAAEPGTLLYLDPISYFIGNLLDYNDCMIGSLMLREVFEARGCTAIGLMHAGKQSTDPKVRYLRLQDRVIGSMAIHGFSDTQMYLASPQETGSSFYTFLWHPHMTPAEEILLSRDDLGLFIPAVANQTPTHTAIMRLVPCTEEGITFKALLFALVQAGQEVSRAHLARLLSDLAAQQLVVKVRFGVYRRPKAN